MSTFADAISTGPLWDEFVRSAGRDEISQSDVDKLVGIVAYAADTAGPLLARIPTMFRHYTEHDIRHSRNLIQLMGRFIPYSTLQHLNAIEIALLFLSALLHDFGMFISDYEREQTLASNEFHHFVALQPDRATALFQAEQQARHVDASYIRDALLAEFFRRIHPERARENITRYLGESLRFNDIDLTRIVGDLAESHGWGTLESSDPFQPTKCVRALKTNQPIYGTSVNLQYLACCLRLADILDFDVSRTPISVFRALRLADPTSWKEWNKHLQITGWSITPTEVLFSAECSRPLFFVAVTEFLDTIDVELRDCRKLLVSDAPARVASEYHYTLPVAVDRSQIDMADPSYVAAAFRFELDYERIMYLLMDSSLYPDRNLFLRELLQNAVDACRYMQALALAHRAEYTPKIVVHDLTRDDSRPRLIVTDNGVGMSLPILTNYFMRVGRSYYRSYEFAAERDRLWRAGVTIDTTSQFGIGVLSCFMVADSFEVDTYRVGNRPLQVSIEGPTRYFVVKTLPEPPRHTFSPEGAEALRSSGTRITVPLLPDVSIDVKRTVQSVAANLEYDITLESEEGSLTIPCGRWQSGHDIDLSRSFLDGDPWRRNIPESDSWEFLDVPPTHATLATNELVIRERVPLNDSSVSDFGGSVWLWLLRGPDGTAQPQSGFVKMDRGWLTLHSTPATFADLMGCFPWRSPSIQVALRALIAEGSAKRFERALRDAWHGDEIRDSGTHQGNVVAIASGLWLKLKEKERRLFCSFIERRSSAEAKPWYVNPAAATSLLNGTMDWTNLAIDIGGAMAVRPSPQSYALRGFSVPGGIVRWDPMAGSAKRVAIFRAGGALALDFRGPAAPQPAASRVFFDARHGTSAAVEIVRAVMRHIVHLSTTRKTKEWSNWASWILQTNLSLPFWQRATYDEIDTIERLGVYRGQTGDEVRKKFGRWISKWDLVDETSDLAGQLIACRPKRGQNGREEVDMTSIVAPPDDPFLAISELRRP